MRAIGNWLYADEFLHLDKLFQNHLFRILFPMVLITQKFYFNFHAELVTRKFYFYLLFTVSNSEILLFLFF